MADLVITSPANPRLKAVLALRRRRVREAEHASVVEGLEELALAVDAGVRPRTLFTCPELYAAPTADAPVAARRTTGEPDRTRDRSAGVRRRPPALSPADALPIAEALVDRLRDDGVETIRLGRAAFEKIAYREGPDGILAVVPAPGRALADLDLGDRPLVLVCEAIEKPGNLGAMLRTADAAGVSAVVAADPVTDWSNPNVVRASKGTVFAVPVATATTAELLDWLDGHGIPLVATTPDTELGHTSVDYRGPVAVAVGAEKYGLTEQALAGASRRVRIPMAGLVNSLNVATSAAIVLYEAVRQRGGAAAAGPPE